MVSKKQLIIAVAVVALIAFFMGEKGDPRLKRLDEILDIVQKEEAITPVALAYKANQLAEFFAPTFDVKTERFNFDRSVKQAEVPRYAAMALKRFAYISISYSDETIVPIGPGESRIQATFRVRADAEQSVRLVAITMVFQEDQWLISALEEVPMVER